MLVNIKYTHLCAVVTVNRYCFYDVSKLDTHFIQYPNTKKSMLSLCELRLASLYYKFNMYMKFTWCKYFILLITFILFYTVVGLFLPYSILSYIDRI